MRTIHKFPLPKPSEDAFTLEMPSDAVPFRIAHQEEQGLQLWAHVETERSMVSHRFYLLGTGWEVPSNAKYVDTTQVGRYVWHLFKA